MKMSLLIITLFSGFAFADATIDHPCKSPNSSTGIEMMEIMEDHMGMGILIDSVDQRATRTELLANNKVTETMARYFARQDYRKDPDGWMSVKDYKKIYTEDDVRNLIIKFHYFNKEKKENIFLVSALANKYECGVRFNGYIIVKREF